MGEEVRPALAAASPVALLLWRAVEAQHVVATRVLVDTLAEQALLEQILEASKPALPGRSLHWLLGTPFRYPPLTGGSRFRGPTDPGVFYGAEAARTACAELGYWRWRFLMASPALEALPIRAQTLFRAAIEARAVDLTLPPLVALRAQFTDPDDYGACQAFAREARAAGVGLLRYESVRDPQHGRAGALLTPAGFASPTPLELETWLLEVHRERVSWHATDALSATRHEFSFRDRRWHAGPVTPP